MLTRRSYVDLSYTYAQRLNSRVIFAANPKTRPASRALEHDVIALEAGLINAGTIIGSKAVNSLNNGNRDTG